MGLAEHTQATARWMVTELRRHPQYLVVAADLEAIGKRLGRAWDISPRNPVLDRQAVEFFIVMTWSLEIEVLKSGTRCNHRLYNPPMWRRDARFVGNVDPWGVAFSDTCSQGKAAHDRECGFLFLDKPADQPNKRIRITDRMRQQTCEPRVFKRGVPLQSGLDFKRCPRPESPYPSLHACRPARKKAWDHT